jgi:hypothetical protein
MDVIEHMRDPEGVFRQLINLLKPGGWVFVKTVNANGLRARRTGRAWRELFNPGHIILFTAVGMEMMLHRCGLVRLQSFRWYLPYEGNRFKDFLHYLLTRLYLGGELIYLGWKPETPQEVPRSQS